MNASGRLSRENSDVQMEIGYTREKISLDKELNSLDRLVIDFTSVLNKLKIKYVIVSGYVSILFGRSRASEDVDLIIERLDAERFRELWDAVSGDFECINTSKADSAYSEYLMEKSAIRFAKEREFIPNIEVNFPKDELDRWTVANRKAVSLNKNGFFISPIEIQISFKLYLGSEKDIEDARHLYRLFKEKLNREILLHFNRKLKVEEAFNKYLR